MKNVIICILPARLSRRRGRRARRGAGARGDRVRYVAAESRQGT
jgi:hypothetical protein